MNYNFKNIKKKGTSGHLLKSYRLMAIYTQLYANVVYYVNKKIC